MSKHEASSGSDDNPARLKKGKDRAGGALLPRRGGEPRFGDADFAEAVMDGQYTVYMMDGVPDLIHMSFVIGHPYIIDGDDVDAQNPHNPWTRYRLSQAERARENNGLGIKRVVVKGDPGHVPDFYFQDAISLTFSKHACLWPVKIEVSWGNFLERFPQLARLHLDEDVRGWGLCDALQAVVNGGGFRHLISLKVPVMCATGLAALSHPEVPLAELIYMHGCGFNYIGNGNCCLKCNRENSLEFVPLLSHLQRFTMQLTKNTALDGLADADEDAIEYYNAAVVAIMAMPTLKRLQLPISGHECSLHAVQMALASNRTLEFLRVDIRTLRGVRLDALPSPSQFAVQCVCYVKQHMLIRLKLCKHKYGGPAPHEHTETKECVEEFAKSSTLEKVRTFFTKIPEEKKCVILDERGLPVILFTDDSTEIRKTHWRSGWSVAKYDLAARLISFCLPMLPPDICRLITNKIDQ